MATAEAVQKAKSPAPTASQLALDSLLETWGARVAAGCEAAAEMTMEYVRGLKVLRPDEVADESLGITWADFERADPKKLERLRANLEFLMEQVVVAVETLDDLRAFHEQQRN